MNICAIILSVQIADDEGFPQNHTFAHAHIYNISFVATVLRSLIQIHRASFHFSIIFTIGSMMSHFSHDVPYIESTYEILCYIFFHHITWLQNDIYLPPPQTIRIKAL